MADTAGDVQRAAAVQIASDVYRLAVEVWKNAPKDRLAATKRSVLEADKERRRVYKLYYDAWEGPLRECKTLGDFLENN
jgi:hypothetical protein